MMSMCQMYLLVILLASVSAGFTFKRDNGDCLTYNKDMKIGSTPTFSKCRNEPNQISWELRQKRFCIATKKICLEINKRTVTLQDERPTNPSQLWTITYQERDNTVKLSNSFRDLCADVSLVMNQLIMSTCDERSRTQKFNSIAFGN